MYLDTENLIQWFETNKRDLPWRHTTDPYAIWLSEIMLQQTRVDTVVDYYIRFLKNLPTVQDLATVSDEKLLKLWEGLGYYSRAKNLKEAAKMIVEQYNGVYPCTYEEVLTLKGIGEYSAGAIVSRAFHLPYACVDGNVLRVLTRYEANPIDIAKNTAKKYFKQKIEQLNPSDFGALNEALMELGATICKFKNPKCEKCPLNAKCLAYKQQNMEEFPVKSKKIMPTYHQYTCLFLKTVDGCFYFETKQQGVLKDMLSPILIENWLNQEDVVQYCKEHQIIIKDIQKIGKQKHVFTHQKWEMQGYIIVVENLVDRTGTFFTKEKITKELSIPICFQKFFKELKIQ